MAEREGFEPSRRFPAYTLSRRAPSTTRPPLRISNDRNIAKNQLISLIWFNAKSTDLVRNIARMHF